MSSLGLGTPNGLLKSQGAPEIADPLKALESILGRPVSVGKPTRASEPISAEKPAILEPEINFASISLEDFLEERAESQLRSSSRATTSQNVGESE